MMRRSWLRAFRFPWRTPEREADDEIAHHLGERVAELIADGADRRVAREQALREFGDPSDVRRALVAIDTRIARRERRVARLGVWVESAVHAWRGLRRAPVYSFISITALGIGLGLCTAAAALVDTLSHPVVPFADVDALYRPVSYGGDFRHPLSADVLLGAIRRVGAVGDVSLAALYATDAGIGDATVRAETGRVLPDYFRLLGLHPRLGRFASATAIEPREAVVSDQFWKRYFGNRTEIGDAHVRVREDDFAIVGVMPEGMREPFGMDIWVTSPDVAHLHAGPWTNIAGTIALIRLKPNVTRAIADAQFATLAANLTAAHSIPARPYSFRLFSLRPDPLGLLPYQKAMIAAVLAVLIIACANVAALTLARGVLRRRDFALRRALGASAGHLAREVLFEVTTVAVVGAVLGAVFAFWGLGALTRLIPADFAHFGIIEPHWSVRAFAQTAAAAAGAIAAAGAAPAWLASRIDPATPLKDSSGTTTRRSQSAFGVLVMAELTMAVVLLVGASLLTKATQAVAHFDFGYDARGLSRISYNLPQNSTAASVNFPASSALLARVRSVPGVQSASTISMDGAEGLVVVSDRTVEGGASLPMRSGYYRVGPGFLATLGVSLIKGRDFTEGDQAYEGAVVLDSASATILFPHEDPIGRRVKLGSLESARPWLPVVGVARNATLQFNNDPDFAREPTVYASAPGQIVAPIVFRTTRSDPRVGVNAQRAVRTSLPASAAVYLLPWNTFYATSLSARNFLAKVFAGLGIISLILATAGLFSVLTYVVGQRMRELAIRMALGARRVDIVRLILIGSAEMAVGGALGGAVLGMWGASTLRAYLYGIEPTDPVALVAAEGVLAASVLLASLPAAIRAMRADPAEVLRAI